MVLEDIVTIVMTKVEKSKVCSVRIMVRKLAMKQAKSRHLVDQTLQFS